MVRPEANVATINACCQCIPSSRPVTYHAHHHLPTRRPPKTALHSGLLLGACWLWPFAALSLQDSTEMAYELTETQWQAAIFFAIRICKQLIASTG
mmetsp:Transcript_5485/g.15479  ORF Transcript_5485/g.15479 Transcript_5485/m.15479 type:complete len:96 (+) Transcript_5485:512-799(+)